MKRECLEARQVTIDSSEASVIEKSEASVFNLPDAH
jgi:hypothetical protein